MNTTKIRPQSILEYKAQLKGRSPEHIVIDGLFNDERLRSIAHLIQEDNSWELQKHTYSKLYVGSKDWQEADTKHQFVQRSALSRNVHADNMAKDFLDFLRSTFFMGFLSEIFDVCLTDINVDVNDINTNYFRLQKGDFVKQHVDESPGREVCLLLYLNQNWQRSMGGELVFKGDEASIPKSIDPVFNRCVIFRPHSIGAEHWVTPILNNQPSLYRYNVTSWYWTK